MANTRQPMGTGRTPTTTQTVGNTRQPSASPSGGARQPIGAVYVLLLEKNRINLSLRNIITSLI